jgi:hypothetical protein
MWEPRRLTTLWASTACYNFNLPKRRTTELHVAGPKHGTRLTPKTTHNTDPILPQGHFIFSSCDTLHSLVSVYPCFGRTYFLHLEGRSHFLLEHGSSVFYRKEVMLTLKMGAVGYTVEMKLLSPWSWSQYFPATRRALPFRWRKNVSQRRSYM